jgi:hypothetical protein
MGLNILQKKTRICGTLYMVVIVDKQRIYNLVSNLSVTGVMIYKPLNFLTKKQELFYSILSCKHNVLGCGLIT